MTPQERDALKAELWGLVQTYYSLYRETIPEHPWRVIEICQALEWDLVDLNDFVESKEMDERHPPLPLPEG
jgi:hypothetical protein